VVTWVPRYNKRLTPNGRLLTAVLARRKCTGVAAYVVFVQGRFASIMRNGSSIVPLAAVPSSIHPSLPNSIDEDSPSSLFQSIFPSSCIQITYTHHLRHSITTKDGIAFHWLLFVGGDDFLFHKTKSNDNDDRKTRSLSKQEKMTTTAMIPTNTKDKRRLLLPRLLSLLLLLILSPLPTTCRSFECFAANDGYVYPGSGTPTVDVDSVLGKAVRAYLNPNVTVSQPIMEKYGTKLNDWCVGDVIAMDSIFYYLSSFK
jgi:hypothetical protein